jgi:chemotaxis protein MotB
MLKRTLWIGIVLLFTLSATGCMVAESKYLKKVDEAESLGKELAALQQKYKDLEAENAALKGQVAKLTEDRDSLDKMLKAKSDELSKNIVDLRKKISDLEIENANLQKSKEEKVQEVSKTYGEMLDKMKKEVAQGEVTITELKGKLTVNMVDAILFASGEAEVKPEGLEVLSKVIDVLKNVKDKAIRVEGHTDNIKIHGALARRFPTNWELSAARAVNVARYLEKEGIDPLLLSTAAYGEYKPVAGNDTKEGRAKNRRIEIVLVPKD